MFQVEWFDKQADLIRNYLLTFYPRDSTIDMVSLYAVFFQRIPPLSMGRLGSRMFLV